MRVALCMCPVAILLKRFGLFFFSLPPSLGRRLPPRGLHPAVHGRVLWAGAGGVLGVAARLPLLVPGCPPPTLGRLLPSLGSRSVVTLRRPAVRAGGPGLGQVGARSARSVLACLICLI